MKALVLHDVANLEVREVPDAVAGPRQVLVRPTTVGVCGTDFQIFDGKANYHTDAAGRQVPLSKSPQILGHEICGVVESAGAAVSGLERGTMVVVDQGWNCSSHGKPLCEYCSTGDTHQCEFYQEHGITGIPGAMAELVAVPAVNVVVVPPGVPAQWAVLSEPLGCVLHAIDVARKMPLRYRLEDAETVLICGAGPAGLLFYQVLRNVFGYSGRLLVAEPNPRKRRLAQSWGATVIDPSAEDLVEAVLRHTHNRRADWVIEASGSAGVFVRIPGLTRKQATLVLYGHGHSGVDLSVLNNVQFTEPFLVAPTGASGDLDGEGRPTTYRRALDLIASGAVKVEPILTHTSRRLDDLPAIFARHRFEPDFVKGALTVE